jgi:chromosome segregation ATPase
VAEGQTQQKAADQIQAELVSEKQARTESEAKIAEANQARAAAAQTITELKQKVVEGEKQYLAPEKNAKALAKLQAELADIRKTNAEVTREVQSVTASRAETEQTVTVLNAKFTTVQTNISALTEQAGVIKQAQVELKTWKQANAAAVEHLNKEKAIADAAEKEKTGLQSRVAELEKQAAEEAGRQKALEQLKGNLAQAKQAWTETEAKLTSTTESQEAARKETADLQRKIKDMENQLDKQAKETMTLKDTQTELSKAQKIRGDLEAKVEKKAQALAAMDKEQSALKSQLADMEKQYAAGQEQMKVAAQAQADLKQERDLRDQADKRMTKMAAQEKARATQIGDLNDQLQTASKKNAALAKDLEHQSQAAVAPAVESKQGSGEPESVTATEKKILAQAKGESETGAAEAAQGADKAKTTEASGVFIPAVSDANRHYMIGIQKWDAGDVDSAIAEFKKTISLDSSLAGAYYNIALGYSRKGDRDEACDYAYQAGKIYLKNKNNQQATRMVVLIRNINPSSSLIDKLRKEISKKQQ